MSWVYTRNGVAVDGATGTITDRLPYSEWPLAAKLANWGIQLHMGLMFGFVNQLLLVAAMLGLITVIVRGYLMWWRRRPTGRTLALGHPPRRGALRRMPWRIAVPLIVVAVLVGWFVPLIGLSLLGFLMVDVVIGLCSRKRAAT